jgi:hypothetical protein
MIVPASCCTVRAFISSTFRDLPPERKEVLSPTVPHRPPLSPTQAGKDR